MKKTMLLTQKGEYVAHPTSPGVLMTTAVRNPEDSPNLKTAYVRVVPGGEILPHIHNTVEIACMTEGCGEILINGEYVPFKAGDGFYAPAGIVHGLKNTGDKDVVIFANFPNIIK